MKRKCYWKVRGLLAKFTIKKFKAKDNFSFYLDANHDSMFAPKPLFDSPVILVHPDRYEESCKLFEKIFGKEWKTIVYNMKQHKVDLREE